MTPERFRALADAYGGNLGRWPAAEHDAGRGHLQNRPEAQAELAAAGQLDAALAAWTVPGPGAALAARIALTVAKRHTRTRRVRVWLSSFGAATALAGGMAVGAVAVMQLAPAAEPMRAPLYELSIFGPSLDLNARLLSNGWR